jgi:hypothetical protein
LLTSVSTPQFYPAQFVYVTDFLDFFGGMVYDRMYRRCQHERKNAGLPPLSAHFEIHDVLEQTRITARNWFGRINEIREIVPRIYGDFFQRIQILHAIQEF